jgi:adenosylhomocysteinase
MVEGVRPADPASRIEWVRSNCRLLQGIAQEFAGAQPFREMTIGTGIHLEPKTVALLLTLRDGGAHVVATGNLNSTQPEAVAYLLAHGVEVVGGPTTDEHEHDQHLRQVLAARPHLILDNGGDLFVRYLEDPYDRLKGGTEETTSGRMRLARLRTALAHPILVINDSPIKQFAENRHAVGQSVLESFLRITNRATNGDSVLVFGYGSVGKGVAASFRNAFATVAVVERDPVLRLEASFDGFQVPDRETGLRSADVVITATGAESVVTQADLDLLKDGVFLANAGHFPREIAVERMLADPRVMTRTEAVAGITTLTLANQRAVHLLAGGHMVNLGGPRPLGNSIESMDLGFALQARCLEAVAMDRVAPDAVVVPVPRFIDALVAEAFLERYR